MPTSKADAKNALKLWQAATLLSKNTRIKAMNELLAEARFSGFGEDIGATCTVIGYLRGDDGFTRVAASCRPLAM